MLGPISWMMVVDVLDAGRNPELCLAQEACEAAVLTIDPLLINQKAKTLFERELPYVRLLDLRSKRLCHAL